MEYYIVMSACKPYGIFKTLKEAEDMLKNVRDKAGYTALSGCCLRNYFIKTARLFE